MNAAYARLRLLRGDHDDLLSLRAWLNDEDALRGQVTVERQTPPNGRMGAVADVLVIALGAGGAVAAVARSLPAWLRPHSDMTIEISDPAGRTVNISAKGAVDPAVIIRAALTAEAGVVTLDADESPGRQPPT